MAQPPLSDAIVLLGATGDLSRRMVLPWLYCLDCDGFMPANVKVSASSRAALIRDGFLARLR